LNELPENPVNEDSISTQPDPRDEDAAPHSTAITFERVLDILEHGTMNAIDGLIRWSSNHTFLASVSYDTFHLPVVYKPQRGERPLWDFPDGTLCQRERAAFLTSQALDWQIVPPTVLREGPRGYGSVQFFIEHDPDYHYFEFDRSFLPQLAQIALFDVIINNADRKGGHCIVDSQGHVWGIDHGITFHAAHKLRTVIWDFEGQLIPQMLMKDVERLAQTMRDPDDAFHQEIVTLLSPRERSALVRRLDHLVTERRYPVPGPGPNHPWPPV
jgi:hypothetical protein